MRVITWDENKLQEGCRRLEEMAREFKPDLIVAIANGGIPVAQYMFPSIPHCKVECQRKSTSVKSRYSMIWSIIRKLPLSVRNFMRIAEAKMLKRNSQSGEVNIDSETLLAIQKSSRILLIDDAVDSGKTLNQVVEHIGEISGDRKVASAVITITTQSPVIVPEYSVYNDSILIRFPWAKDV